MLLQYILYNNKKKFWHILLGCFLLFLVNKNVTAQITKIEVGINGLTCSQCSRSVEMQMRKIEGIKEVNMKLDKTVAEVEWGDAQAAIPFSKLAQAVRDAGFSVRFLAIMDTLKFNENTATANGQKFCVIDNANSDKYFLVGKEYLPPSNWKAIKQNLKNAAYISNDVFYLTTEKKYEE